MHISMRAQTHTIGLDGTVRDDHAVKWYLALVIGLTTFAAPDSASAQVSPECLAGARVAPRSVRWHPSQQEVSVADTLEVRIREAARRDGGTGADRLLSAVRPVFERRPQQVEAALAYLLRKGTAESTGLGPEGWLYFTLSGDARPVLRAVRGEELGAIANALHAVRVPLDTASEAEVFQYACDAAWRIFAAASDSTGYANVRPTASDAGSAHALIFVASRLLSGRRAALLVEMTSRAFDQYGISIVRYGADPSTYEPIKP